MWISGSQGFAYITTWCTTKRFILVWWSRQRFSRRGYWKFCSETSEEILVVILGGCCWYLLGRKHASKHPTVHESTLHQRETALPQISMMLKLRNPDLDIYVKAMFPVSSPSTHTQTISQMSYKWHQLNTRTTGWVFKFYLKRQIS